LAENIFAWSITAADNDDADTAVPWAEGMVPGSVNNSARALMAAVARFRDDITGAVTTTGSAGSYAFTSRSDFTALATNLSITAKASVTNTAGATLNVNTLGAKSIRVFVGGAEAAVAAGQIIIGGRYQFVYDTALNSAAGGWLLLNPSPDPIQAPQVGEIKFWTSDTLPSGRWLWLNGGTIGNASSSGSVLADAEASALFVHLWNAYADAQLAVSGGRGANAAADFAANKRIALPDARGRSFFGTDDMGGGGTAGRITNAGSGIVGTTLGVTGGAETHTLTTAQLASHSHTGTTGANSVDHTHSGTTGTESASHTHSESHTGPANTSGAAGETPNDVWRGSNATFGTTATASNTHTHAITTGIQSQNHTHDITTNTNGSGSAHNNMPPALILNYCIRY